MSSGPDSRDLVRDVVLRYRDANPHESAVVERILHLLARHPDCLLRTCRVGHVTASALVLSSDHRSCLLTHHRKLDRWLQLGGHVDGEAEPHLSALREAREESGMTEFSFLPPLSDGSPLPFDLDVHSIPARKDEPEHEHHDFRYLLVAAPGQVLHISDESNDLQWFPLEQIAFESSSSDESLARLARKALALRPLT
jgi:8-oxo-dGTP pyrophosphatase MutT (NUDIX family)